MMAFGFGFNKAKTLASAEKNVKQGKLHNAISDYEKVVKEDPKDLNVLNTIGDLYARVGKTEQSAACFRKVGDAYAAEGFTVKAIAMYKKLTKLSPTASEIILKLADLYAQQGLNNDARVQYTAVVEQHLRQGQLESACSVFHKMLELDPDNPQMQGRLAELYVRLGKKAEARDIFFRSAQTLRSRGALKACDDALGQVLQMDPGFSQAVLQRGQVKLEADDAEGAVHCLETLADLDSRPEALRVLLRAQLKLDRHADAEPLARKLLSVYNDPSGLTQYAEALQSAGDYDSALRLYREHADRLLAANAPGLVETLHNLIARVKLNPRALECLSELFTKAATTTHLAEVTELLAHAYVQEGTLLKARDLYQKLAEMEPENPLHLQNYRQIVARLGQDPAIRTLTPEEGSQALMVEEVEDSAPLVEQKYAADVEEEIRAALTDAELFASYNLLARAIPPLEAALPRAPEDVQLNQRLASLYARTGHYAEAARCCDVLRKVFADAGHARQAREYVELALKYRQRGGIPASAATAPSDAAVVAETIPAPAPVPQMAAAPADDNVTIRAAADVVVEPVTQPLEAPAHESVESKDPAPPAPADEVGAHEIDLSEEWDRIMADEPPAVTRAEEPEPASAPIDAPVAAVATAAEPGRDAAFGDLLEEIQFYVSQAMWDEARAAFARAEAMAPDAPALCDFRGQLAAAPASVPKTTECVSELQACTAAPEPNQDWIQEPSTEPPAEPVQDVIQEFAVSDTPEPVLPSEPFEPTAEAEPPLDYGRGQQAPDAAEEIGFELSLDPQAEAAPAEVAVDFEPDSPAELNREGQCVLQAPETPAGTNPPDHVELDFGNATAAPEASGFETGSNQGDDAGEPTSEAQPEPLLAVHDEIELAVPRPDELGDLVLGLEDSLGADFGASPAPPVASPEPGASVQAQEATGLSLSDLIADDVEGSDSTLSDLFAEFKQDVESGSPDEDDPETHYNLGVAFKEMGLLDEAIGELQKVCQSVDHGVGFAQIVEAYTWLADCFVQKGVPEAAIRWYEKALSIPRLGDERAVAIQYELACAQQAAGNLPAARQHFMHVLSVNIDYRDVAERIKAIKS